MRLVAIHDARRQFMASANSQALVRRADKQEIIVVGKVIIATGVALLSAPIYALTVAGHKTCVRKFLFVGVENGKENLVCLVL